MHLVQWVNRIVVYKGSTLAKSLKETYKKDEADQLVPLTPALIAELQQSISLIALVRLKAFVKRLYDISNEYVVT